MSKTLSIPIGIKNIVWRDIFPIILATIILGAPTLIYPFGRDQGEYAWIATSTLNGILSYSEIFNVKPPFTHLIHQVALVSFGYKIASIRILDLLWQFATAIFIFKIAKQIGQPRVTSIFAAVVYLLSYFIMDYWTIAQTDGFLNLPITAGILLFLRAQQKIHFWIYAASGVAIGLGTLFKYPIGILIVFLSLLILIRKTKNCLFSVLWLGIGFAAPLAVGTLVMLLRGNLADFLWIQSTFISRYSTMPILDLSYARTIIHVFFAIYPVLGWGSLFGIYGLFSGHSRSGWMKMTVLATWWASAVIHFVIQNKFYGYHTLPILAPLALMTSNLFVDVTKMRGLFRFAIGVWGIWLMVFQFFSYNFPQKYVRLYDVAVGEITLQMAYGDEMFTDSLDFSVRADMEIAEYLIANTNQDERIFIWGFEPGIYFLSQRRNATRFIYNFPLYGPNATSELQQEFLKDIREQKPVYIAIVRNDSIFHVTATNQDSWTAFISFGEFQEFVLENYQVETTIENFVIYRFEP